MKKLFLVFVIVAAVALPASAAFSQQKETPPAKGGQGMMEGMQGGGVMCPMMGMGGMGMMGEMMGGMGGDPKAMARMMEMRGEMMMKYGKEMQKGEMK